MQKHMARLVRSLQRVLHPDKHQGETAEQKRQTMSSISGELTTVYHRLRAEDELFGTSDTLVDTTPDPCPIGATAFVAPP